MTLDLPVIPKLGEVFLAINLSAVENMTVLETLKLIVYCFAIAVQVIS